MKALPCLAVILVLLAAACDGANELSPTPTLPSQGSQSSTPAKSEQATPGPRSNVATARPIPTATATAEPAQRLTPVREPLILRPRHPVPLQVLPADMAIREIGSYLFEVNTGRLLQLGALSYLPSRGGYIPGQSREGIEVVDLGREEKTQIADGAVRLWDWSSDGESFLATVSYNDGQRNLYLIKRDGSSARLLLPGDIAEAAWRPGHEAFVYRVDERVFLYEMSDGNQTLIAEGQRTSGTGFSTRIRGWSGDGKWLLLAVDNDLHVFNVETDEQALLSSKCCSLVAWSPVDNALLVGVTRDRGLNGDIFVVEEQALLSGSDVQAGEPLAGGLQPAWSPDGQEIAFLEDGCTENWLIRLIGRNGSGLRTPTGQSDARKYYFSWSPDGRYITYAGHPQTGTGPGYGGEMLLLDLEEGTERVIGRAESLDPSSFGPIMSHPQFSAHGDWILFEAGGGFGVCMG